MQANTSHGSHAALHRETPFSFSSSGWEEGAGGSHHGLGSALAGVRGVSTSACD